MKAPFNYFISEPDERAIRLLSDQSGVPLGQVRTLFRNELRRIGMGAKVGSYLAVLTASSVRGMLRRSARPAGAERPLREYDAAREQRYLQRWEDDGGRARGAPDPSASASHAGFNRRSVSFLTTE